MSSIGEIIAGKPLIHAESSDNVRSVARTMTEANVGAVAVLEKGVLVGLFSERDLMSRVVARKLDPDTTPVSTVMTREISVASPGNSLADCMEKMQALGCRHLPVVEQGQLLGMISLRDLLQIDSQRSRARAEFLRELVTYERDYDS